MLKNFLMVMFVSLLFSTGIVLTSDCDSSDGQSWGDPELENVYKKLKDESFFERQPGDGIELELSDGRVVDLKDFYKLDMKIQESTELGKANLERLKEEKKREDDEAREIAFLAENFMGNLDSKLASVESYMQSNLNFKKIKRDKKIEQFDVEIKKMEVAMNESFNDAMVQICLQCCKCCAWMCGLQNDNTSQKNVIKDQKKPTTQQMKRE